MNRSDVCQGLTGFQSDVNDLSFSNENPRQNLVGGVDRVGVLLNQRDVLGVDPPHDQCGADDSNPDAEYQETFDKVARILPLLDALRQ